MGQFRAIEDIEALLHSGENVDARDRHGWSALMHASAEGRSPLVSVLLSAGAMVDFSDVHDGWTALFHVAAVRYWTVT